jgi:hypothetical protein
VPRIAVIQDGTEVARQRFADVSVRFQACCENLSREGVGEFTAQTFVDDDTLDLFAALDPDEWGCLAFASNALRSGKVETALVRRADDVGRYIRAGGGIVVLHQSRESLAPLLPTELLPAMAERTAPRGEIHVHPVARDDVLLHYPTAVDWSVLRDFTEQEVRTSGARAGSELPSLFFRTLDRETLPAALIPVLGVQVRELVLARTGDHVSERVVVSTMPLDWQFERPEQGTQIEALLTNALRFAALGTPRRLVWRRPKQDSNPLVVRWLATGGSAFRAAPVEPRPLDATERWLLTAVDLFVVPEDRRVWVEAEEPVERFLAAGGALVAAADTVSGRTRVAAVIGRYEERILAARLLAELRAVDGWRSLDSAFDLRNIVAAVAFLRDTAPADDHQAAKLLDELAGLSTDLRTRLADPTHREDLGSSIALAETLVLLDAGADLSRELEWLCDEGTDRPLDVALQIRSVLLLAEGQLDQAFLQETANGLAVPGTSLASLVRVLESVGRLAQHGLLAEDRDSTTRVAETACGLLESAPYTTHRGWLSVEGTAHLTRGLVALYSRLPEQSGALGARVADQIARGANALRLARRHYEQNAKGVAWLACIVHAVVVAEQLFPIGLQRLASLEWPERLEISSPVERQLLQRLANENEKLRREERKLRDEVQAQLAQRLAASLGRGVATLAPTALLVAAAVFVVLRVGWSSAGALLVAIATAGTLVIAALGVVFVGLERWHLLAAPAPRLLQLAKGVPDTVKTLGGALKGG